MLSWPHSSRSEGQSSGELVQHRLGLRPRPKEGPTVEGIRPFPDLLPRVPEELGEVGCEELTDVPGGEVLGGGRSAIVF